MNEHVPDGHGDPRAVRRPSPAVVAPGDDPLVLAAELLVHHGCPEATQRMVNEHTPDRSGHCRGCPHAGTSTPVHPCRMRLIGEAAERLRDQLAAARRRAR